MQTFVSDYLNYEKQQVCSIQVCLRCASGMIKQSCKKTQLFVQVLIYFKINVVGWVSH